MAVSRWRKQGEVLILFIHLLASLSLDCVDGKYNNISYNNFSHISYPAITKCDFYCVKEEVFIISSFIAKCFLEHIASVLRNGSIPQLNIWQVKSSAAGKILALLLKKTEWDKTSYFKSKNRNQISDKLFSLLEAKELIFWPFQSLIYHGYFVVMVYYLL